MAVAWPLYLVMIVFTVMGVAVIVSPSKLLARYYSAERMEEFVASSMWPAFVSITRYVGIFCMVFTYYIASQVADGDVDDAATMSCMITVPIVLANVFRLTLEVQLSPKTWSSEAAAAAKINGALFGACMILSLASLYM